MKTPSISIESWSTKRRVLTASGAALALFGGALAAAIVSQNGDGNLPVVATADGDVSNAGALVTEAETAFSAWVHEAGATTPDPKVGGEARCFFNVAPEGFVASALECGPARVTGSNTGSYYAVDVTFSVDSETQEVTGALIEQAVFTKSPEAGGTANLVRPDGLASLPASILDQDMKQPFTEAPMRLAGVGGAPAFDQVTIPTDGIDWNEEIDNATVSTSGGVSATIVRTGVITEGVIDPKTGVTYAPEEGEEWWIVETSADTTPGAWDGYAARGTYIGTDWYSGKAGLKAGTSTIVNIAADSPLLIFVWGDYTVLDAGFCTSTTSTSGEDDNHMVITPSDRVVVDIPDEPWD